MVTFYRKVGEEHHWEGITQGTSEIHMMFYSKLCGGHLCGHLTADLMKYSYMLQESIKLFIKTETKNGR